MPKILKTDNGSEYATEVEKLVNSIGIVHRKGEPYCPFQQGTVEAFNKTLKQMLIENVKRNPFKSPTSLSKE